MYAILTPPYATVTAALENANKTSLSTGAGPNLKCGSALEKDAVKTALEASTFIVSLCLQLGMTRFAGKLVFILYLQARAGAGEARGGFFPAIRTWRRTPAARV